MVLKFEVYEMGKKEYSSLRTLKKAMKYFLIFGLPTLVEQLVAAFPNYSGVTVGALFVAGANWYKNKNV